MSCRVLLFLCLCLCPPALRALSLDSDTVTSSPGTLNTFGTAAIKSLTFTYGSGSGTVTDPAYQHVGIHDVTFTPVPELNPAWSAVGSCLITAALILRHSAKFRK
jgi:hypothetical protein